MNEAEREELLAQIRAERDEFAERITKIVNGTTTELVARINDLYGLNEDLRKEFFDLYTRVAALEIGVDPALLRERLEKAKADQAAKAARSKLSIVKSDTDPKSSA